MSIIWQWQKQSKNFLCPEHGQTRLLIFLQPEAKKDRQHGPRKTQKKFKKLVLRKTKPKKTQEVSIENRMSTNNREQREICTHNAIEKHNNSDIQAI